MGDVYFEKKVAIVTGAGGKLCSVIAKHLAERGCYVVLIGRTFEKLKKTADIFNINIEENEKNS